MFSTIFFTIFFRNEFEYDLLHEEKAKIQNIWHEFMKNENFGVPRRVCIWIYNFIPWIHINDSMENNEFMYEFMEKTYDFWGTKKGLHMNSYTWIHI